MLLSPQNFASSSSSSSLPRGGLAFVLSSVRLLPTPSGSITAICDCEGAAAAAAAKVLNHAQGRTQGEEEEGAERPADRDRPPEQASELGAPLLRLLPSLPPSSFRPLNLFCDQLEELNSAFASTFCLSNRLGQTGDACAARWLHSRHCVTLPMSLPQ